jgi:hypothetical protein
MIIDSPIISGSYSASGSLNQFGNVVISGSLTVTGSIIGTALTATSASYAASSSFAQNALTASYLSNYIAPFPFTGSAGISGSLVVNGNITATTLVVQTITSSIDYVTGSTRFGSIISNTHQFTGSVTTSGSLAVSGPSSATLFMNPQTLGDNVVIPSGYNALVLGPVDMSASIQVGSGSNLTILESLTNLATTGSNSFVGNQVVTGSITATAGLTGSLQGTASYAANANLLNGLDSTVFTLTSSFAAQTASFTAFSSSVNAFSASQNLFTASLNTFSASVLSYTASQDILNGTYTLTSSFAAQTASFTAFTSSVNVFSASILAQTASFTAFSASVLTFTGSAATRLDALESYTSSLNNKTSSFATTGSNTFEGIQTINSNLVVTGSITAQTLVVQTITSSVDFVTGSTRFGSLLANTHVFSGSVTMNPNGLFVSGSGLVGIGTTSPAYTLDVNGTGRFSGAILIDCPVNANQGNLVITSTNNDASGLSFKVRASPSDPTNSRSWMLHTNYSAAGTLEILRSTTATGNPTTLALKFDGSTGAATFTANSTTLNVNTSTRVLEVTGKNSYYATQIIGGTGTGTSYGLSVNAGTNSSDVAFQVYNQTETAIRLFVRGDGNVGIGTSLPRGLLQIYGAEVAAYKTYTGQGNTGGGDTIINAYRLDGASAYLRVTDIVALGDDTNNRGSTIRLMTTNTSGVTSAALTLASTGAATFSSNQIGATGLIITNSSTDTTASAVARFNNSGSNVTYIGLGSTARASYVNIGANILSMYTDNAAGMSFLVDANGPMSFATNSTTRLTIASTGAATFSSCNYGK